MADRANQHFVPQFYFKLFTHGERRIHVLLKRSDRIVFNASIKGQCAGHKFYGPKNLESANSEIEARHSAAIRRMIELAWGKTPEPLAPEHLAWLWEAVLFQRARTPLEREKKSPAMEALYLEVFKEHLRHAEGIRNRGEVLTDIERGAIRITQAPQSSVAFSIVSALTHVLLISDLDFHLLRNDTQYPFIFSDSPVVFYNTYYRNVRDRGVLGIQTPGLQIFYPLDPRTLLMLIDNQAYSGRYADSLHVDISQPSDVSQLNALQVHNSLDAVYFVDRKHAAYVSDLWQTEKPRVVQPKNRLQFVKAQLVDGSIADVYHMFEPQLNVGLDLSFIECTPIYPADYRFRHRSPQLVKENEKRLKRTEVAY
jgi:hypothetical protein